GTRREAVFEHDRDVPVGFFSRRAYRLELVEGRAQWLVGKYVRPGPQRGDSGLSPSAVDTGDKGDVHVVHRQQLLRRIVQRGTQPAEEALPQPGVGLGDRDQLQLVALRDLGQGIVDVLVGSPKNGDLHRISSGRTRRPVRAAVVRASIKRTVAAPSAAETAGARLSEMASRKSLHCWT